MCVCAKTTRRGSRRSGPFYLFTQLSGGDFAVGVTLPPVLRLASSHLSFTKVYSFPLVFERVRHDSLRPQGPSSKACLLSGVKERRVETGECPGPMLAP